MSRWAEEKAQKREELREWFTEAGKRRRFRVAREQPYQHNCFSQTCIECGRVWISAIRPIKTNAWRGRRKVYICSRCR